MKIISAAEAQRQWAHLAGVAVDAKGYVQSLDMNLRRPMRPETEASFKKGSGSELTTKMLAVHSSSALVVNFFEYWTDVDRAALSAAMETDASITSIAFEHQVATGAGGNPANLDLLLVLDNKRVVGVESKFGEWLTKKSGSQQSFKDKYFENKDGAWHSAGLAQCEILARKIQSGQMVFNFLDAPQLLKHALGLARHHQGNASLWYLYFDWDCEQAQQHQREIAEFESQVGAELNFKALRYQDVFAKLAHRGSPAAPDYVAYLQRRYFTAA